MHRPDERLYNNKQKKKNIHKNKSYITHIKYCRKEKQKEENI